MVAHISSSRPIRRGESTLRPVAVEHDKVWGGLHGGKNSQANIATALGSRIIGGVYSP